MHKQLSLALTVLISNVHFFENIMKPDMNFIQNSVGPDRLASLEASLSGPALFSKQHASLK